MITAKLTDSAGVEITATYDHENPDSGNTWLTKLDGWTGGVSVKGEQLGRSGHGDFSLPNKRSRRNLTLGFMAERDSRAELWQLERGLSGLFADGGFGTLQITQDGLVQYCDVELDGEVKPIVQLEAGVLEAEIPLSAPVPWIYGEWKQAQLRPQDQGIGLAYDLFSVDGVLTYGTDIDSEHSVWNDGNAPSYPVYTVYADTTGGFRIRQGDSFVTWPMPTFKDVPVEVHMSGKVMVSGFDQSHVLSDRGWAPIPAHSMEKASFELLRGGSGWATVAFRDTSI